MQELGPTRARAERGGVPDDTCSETSRVWVRIKKVSIIDVLVMNIFLIASIQDESSFLVRLKITSNK